MFWPLNTTKANILMFSLNCSWWNPSGFLLHCYCWEGLRVVLYPRFPEENICKRSVLNACRHEVNVNYKTEGRKCLGFTGVYLFARSTRSLALVSFMFNWHLPIAWISNYKELVDILYAATQKRRTKSNRTIFNVDIFIKSIEIPDMCDKTFSTSCYMQKPILMQKG